MPSKAAAGDVRAGPKGKIKKFLQRMKQKLGIVTPHAQPGVLVLDEPTSGLDPLMQIDSSISSSASNGKQDILMSSHSFDEVERTCDNVLIIKKAGFSTARRPDTQEHQRRATSSIEVHHHALQVLKASDFEVHRSPVTHWKSM